MIWRKLVPVSVLVMSTLAGCSNEPANDGSLRGKLAVSVATMRDGTSEKVFALVLDESERDERRIVFAEEPDLAPGSEIKVWGELDGNDILVRRFEVLADDARNGVGQTQEALIDAPPHPNRTVGVVLVSSDGMATAYPPSRATTDYFGQGAPDRSLKQWFGESSYGVQDITGAVVSLTRSFFGCTLSPGNTTLGWVSETNTALGMTPNHYVWILLDAGPCDYYSLSAVGGAARDQWIFGTSQLVTPGLGCALRTHGPLSNVGHPPSSSLDCDTEPLANDPRTCTQRAFGDPEDAMSLANCRHLNAVGKQYEGWFGGCNSVRVNETGTFTLLPTEIECNGIQVLQVPMPTVGLPTNGRQVTTENGSPEAVGFYYLELRTNTGFDSGTGRTPRVVVRIAGDYIPRGGGYGRRTFFLDMNPATSAFDGMIEGQTFTDPAGGVAFTVQTLSNTSATVSVTVPTSAPNTCAGGGTIAAPGPLTCTSAAGGMGGMGGMGGAGGMAGAGGASGGMSGAGGVGGAGAGGVSGASGAGAGGVAGTSGTGGLGAGGMAGTGGASAAGAGGAAGSAGANNGGTGGGSAGATSGGNGGAGGEDAGGAGAGGDGEGGNEGGSAGDAGEPGTGGTSGSAGASTGGVIIGNAGSGGRMTGGTPPTGDIIDDIGSVNDDDSGCGCRIDKAPPRRDAALVIGLLGLLAVRRRRSHRRAS
jgi:MYXO-CTERM domain-containing protein